MSTITYDSIETIPQTTDLAQNVWKRFRRHRGAIAGMIIFGILILVCVAAFLSPYDPEASNLPKNFNRPLLNTGSARMRLDATSSPASSTADEFRYL